ncbi:MAG: hypothetical protein R3F34_21015 [Planctomycetota bacterium]
MINGAHVIVYSTSPELDRAFLRDVLGLPHVDVGHGWLIFALPPAEVACHPSESNGRHELYFMCDDVRAFVARMRDLGVACTEPDDQGWGVLSTLTLPGGGEVGVYEPRHARPPQIVAVEPSGAARKRTTKRAVKKAAKKAATKSKKKAAAKAPVRSVKPAAKRATATKAAKAAGQASTKKSKRTAKKARRS